MTKMMSTMQDVAPTHAVSVPTTLRLLADETRWRLVSELRWSDWQVGEICARLGLPQNLVSYHLGLMRAAGLVQSHRSDADGRALYYGLNLVGLRDGLAAWMQGRTAPVGMPSYVDFLAGVTTALDHVRDGTITDGETVASLLYAALALDRL